MLSRHLLPFALLLLAASAQGMTPNRQGANGGGGSCPEAQAQAAAEAAAVPNPALVADGGASDATAAPGTAPAPVKATQGARVKAGTRWHSFLPGMFK